MNKKIAWISLLSILIIVLGYIVVDLQYKPDLSAFSKNEKPCAIDATLKEVLPQESILATNPFGKTKRLELLNEKGAVIDLNTTLLSLIAPDQLQTFMMRMSSNLDSKPLPLKFYIRPILKQEPIEFTVTLKSDEVTVEPILLNFKTDRIPDYYSLKYQGNMIKGPSNPWAGTDEFNFFEIVGQPFIRKDINNVYYIDIQDKKVFDTANIEKLVLKTDGDKPDEFCGDLLDDAFNSLPLRVRFFALQEGLAIRWKDMLEITEEDIRLYNEGYADDSVQSVKAFAETRLAYYDTVHNAIEVNNHQGYKTNFASLFNQKDIYYTVEGDRWSKATNIYNTAQLKKYALKDIKNTLAHEIGHFLENNVSNFYISEKEQKIMKDELPYAYKAVYKNEVIATAFSVYFTEQERMQLQAPTSYKVCKDLLSRLDMSLADQLVELSKSN